MNLDANLLLGVMIALAWALSLPVSALSSVILALIVFLSDSIPVGILLLISLNMISLLQSIRGAKRTSSGVTQRKYFLTFFGLFTALMGTTLSGSPLSQPIMFFGLLLSVSTGVTAFFFSAHFERLRLNSFLISEIIPSLVSIDLLLKVKTGMKAEYAPLWEISLIAIGSITQVASIALALGKRRLRPALVYFSLTWIGVLLFLLVVESDEISKYTFAAISILIVTSSVLLNLGSQLGHRFFTAAKIFCFGLPGFIGFSALFLSLKMTYAFNPIWLFLLGGSYFIVSISIFRIDAGVVNVEKRKKIRFWLISAVQLFTGLALLSIERGLFR